LPSHAEFEIPVSDEAAATFATLKRHMGVEFEFGLELHGRRLLFSVVAAQIFLLSSCAGLLTSVLWKIPRMLVGVSTRSVFDRKKA
jgi:hypothetical protein